MNPHKFGFNKYASDITNEKPCPEAQKVLDAALEKIQEMSYHERVGGIEPDEYYKFMWWACINSSFKCVLSNSDYSKLLS